MYSVENMSSLASSLPLQPSFGEKKQDCASNKPAHFVISVPPINIPDYLGNNQVKDLSTSKSKSFNDAVLASFIRENDKRCTTPEENQEKNIRFEKILPVVTPTGTSAESGVSQGITQSNQTAQIFPVTVQTIHGQTPIILPSSFSQITSFPSHLINSNIPIIPSGGFDSTKTSNHEVHKVVTEMIERDNVSSIISRTKTSSSSPIRLNKFVRRLHDMLQSERNSGIVEWCKGLLILHSTDTFAKKILPKYFNTRNFKTFRRQLNYYGFVHVRSFSTTGSTTTALWVNQDLAKHGTDSISSVLLLKRVEPCEAAKTAEGRRIRKEEAAHAVEDIGITNRTLQVEHINESYDIGTHTDVDSTNQHINALAPIPSVVHCVVPQREISKLQSQNELIEDFSPATASTNDAANLLLMLSQRTPSQ